MRSPSKQSGRGYTVAGRVENVTETREGVFQVDIESLMRGNPAVLKIRDGVYRIDLSVLPRSF